MGDFILRITIGCHYVIVILREINSSVFLMGFVRSNGVLIGIIKENVRRLWETNVFHSKSPALRPKSKSKFFIGKYHYIQYSSSYKIEK